MQSVSPERWEATCGCALKRYENDIALLVNCGSAFQQIDLLEKAQEFYSQALEIDPQRPELLNNIGWLLERKGGAYLPEALDYYRKAAHALHPLINDQIEANIHNIQRKLNL